jgi:poly(U)-specific endoribonuclease
VDYAIDLQGCKRSSWESGDRAERPLFKFVDPDVLARESWRTFIALLDNYDFESGVAERVTAQEVKEEDDFLNINLKTPCMQYVHRYLVAKKLAPERPSEFKKFLHDLWFGLYRRKVNNDSSGFEHVFVGEEKTKDDGTSQVVGLHNWIQIFIEEGGNLPSKRQGAVHLDYMGYIKPRCRVNGGDDHQRIISVQMEWHNDIKPESSVFIGTSPAFELALYTLCFLAGEENNLVQLGPYMVEITCYKYRGAHGKIHIGSCFPALSDVLSPSEAAAKIQAVHRGKALRKTGSPQDIHEKHQSEKAASAIQKTFRGNRARNLPKQSFFE